MLKKEGKLKDRSDGRPNAYTARKTCSAVTLRSGSAEGRVAYQEMNSALIATRAT